jgi:hypothetical protein
VCCALVLTALRALLPGSERPRAECYCTGGTAGAEWPRHRGELRGRLLQRVHCGRPAGALDLRTGRRSLVFADAHHYWWLGPRGQPAVQQPLRQGHRRHACAAGQDHLKCQLRTNFLPPAVWITRVCGAGPSHYVTTAQCYATLTPRRTRISASTRSTAYFTAKFTRGHYINAGYLYQNHSKNLTCGCSCLFYTHAMWLCDRSKCVCNTNNGLRYDMLSAASISAS